MSPEGIVLSSILSAMLSTSAPPTTLDAATTNALVPASAPHDARLGGSATVDAVGPHAFSLPIPGLSREDRRAFSVGNSFFRDNWVVAPASAAGRDGLGPLFNANSCSACHPDDGRGRPPLGAVVFISPRDADGAPHPVYGVQIQDQAIPGVAPEATLALVETAEAGRYGDGSAYELARLAPRLERPAYGPLGELRISLRIGPQLIGGGLLEAVGDAAILASADPDDRDGDGISGRAHVVSDEAPRVGRFGWKASQPTLDAQVMAALQQDMGITNPAHAGEPTTAAQAIGAPSGGDPEADARKVARIAHYCRLLAVPAQRIPEDSVELARHRRGAELFDILGCAKCHARTLRTDASAPIERLRNVEFHPFTDLLLHDMGAGLADDRRDGDASGREWRTPPLWGIGLIETVNGHTRLLHDGRARSIEEAILWHGGEADHARNAFRDLPKADREALVAYLRSL
jgi:CxxC motif-containing protein (DUF1111 family)